MTSPPWQLCSVDPFEIDRIVDECGCPRPIATLLQARGLATPALRRAFFAPELKDLHAPELLLGMEPAVSRIQHAVSSGEPVLIYGDYDVDGTLAIVLLKTAIERLGSAARPAQVSWHVPHRIHEGYGMRESRLAQAAASGVRLVISVDTGIRAFAAAREARALGLDLIITDHHLVDQSAGVPDAVAVINPAQAGCAYPFKELCGAAVAFKLAHALLRQHALSSPEPEAALARLETALLPSLLKLVAIATIADSVPLVDENRTIAVLGLRGLMHPVQPGLRALLEVSGVPPDRPPTAPEIGFRVAPRINAAGRMDIADDVINLFLTRSPDQASEVALKLNILNEERRATEREALADIDRLLPEYLGDRPAFPAATLVLDGQGWHRGVLGILASRVVERTGRPALVITHEKAGESHGSGRSIQGFHLLDALTAAHAMGCDAAPPGTLFSRFGGHAHAAGFALDPSHIAILRHRLSDAGPIAVQPEALSAPLACDAALTEEELSDELATWVERCAPFGNGHAEPVFLTRGLRVAGAPRLIKDRHLCLPIQSAPGCPPLQAVGWSRTSNPGETWAARASRLALASGSRIDAVYRLARKAGPSFQGLELQLIALELSSPTSP